MSRMDPQDARQGRKGTPVLRILIIALALMVIGGIGMSIYGYVMPDQTLPKADAGGDVGTSTSTTTPAGQGDMTVTPQTSGGSANGGAAN